MCVCLCVGCRYGLISAQAQLGSGQCKPASASLRFRFLRLRAAAASAFFFLAVLPCIRPVCPGDFFNSLVAALTATSPSPWD